MVLFFLLLDKNIQCRERVLQLPSLITGTILCLIMAYEKIISLIDVPDESTLFSLSSSSVLIYNKFLKHLNFTSNCRRGSYNIWYTLICRGGATLVLLRLGLPPI